MNIDEWSAALHKANLIPEFSDVLDGFNQGIPPNHNLGPQRPFFTPNNHTSAWEVKGKIEEKLAKEVLEGQMFGPFTHEQVKKKFKFFRSNPLGAVTNGDGSLRPTNDLSAREGPVLLAIFDWEKAYRQIPTAMDQWPFLMIKNFKGNLLLDTRITFGGVAGCGSFGRPADAWKRIMLHEFDLIQIFRWVDDNLFIKDPNSTTRMETIVDRSNTLGVKTNSEKFSPFAFEQKYIGFLWNGKKKTVRLPDGKLFDRLAQLKQFANQPVFLYKEVEVMVGRLNHVSYLLPQLRTYLCSFYRWLKSWIVPRAPRELPLDVKADLERWTHTLLRFKETRLIPNPEPTEIGWVGDASTGFGMGILIGHRWAQFQLVQGWNRQADQDGGIAWLETVAIRLGLLMLEELGIKQGKTFIVWTDNTTTEGAIRKRKSKDKWVNEEWKLIQDNLVRLQTDIEGRRVTSNKNRADALSRGITEGHQWRHLVTISLPQDLERHMFQVYL
ncbi:hypothetical protein MJO28_006283 [Puccinia striiformis f. sp. tritici]|uniref:Uncharacterized protein n=1 Tax=Puccinia striiformis f. sp. tritici TaxID=168172 RepID=A0ACC0EIJ7_9BASI|nr:hypothetical protein MJO28_006283 [Puccinia striiformis f. sp. tritici]